MKIRRKNKYSILFCHGFRHSPSQKEDVIYNTLNQGLPKNIKIDYVDLDDENPMDSYNLLRKIQSKYDMVIGFSMGGFFAELLEIPCKILVNPGYYMPKYLELMRIHKGLDIKDKSINEFKKLSKGLFKYKPNRILGVFGTNDLKVGTSGDFIKHHGKDNIVWFTGGHVIDEASIKQLILPFILDYFNEDN